MIAHGDRIVLQIVKAHTTVLKVVIAKPFIDQRFQVSNGVIGLTVDNNRLGHQTTMGITDSFFQIGIDIETNLITGIRGGDLTEDGDFPLPVDIHLRDLDGSHAMHEDPIVCLTGLDGYRLRAVITQDQDTHSIFHMNRKGSIRPAVS